MSKFRIGAEEVDVGRRHYRLMILVVAAILAVTPASLSIAATGWGTDSVVIQPAPPAPDVAPPSLGRVVFEASMTEDGSPPMPRSVSPSGLVIREPVGEGYIFKVRGPSEEGGQDTAVFDLDAIDIVPVHDGEVRVEAKAVNGADRAAIFLWARRGWVTKNAYIAVFHPGLRVAMFMKHLDGSTTELAPARDAVGQIRPDDWNTYALRLQGPKLWVLVNDEVVMTAEDASLESGSVRLMVSRTGRDRADPREVAVVFRDLRITELAD